MRRGSRAGSLRPPWRVLACSGLLGETGTARACLPVRMAPLHREALGTPLANGRTVRVHINDRGPAVPGRVLDLSDGAARALERVRAGVARVTIAWRGSHEAIDSNEDSPYATE